ncbi:MAG: diacylglycerol O-acyltransferase / trehalose O-mycolyltransferase [Solirubrobacteraceae bacterium]|jgi:S-formylglutathione hydrolase FrmB|nr:diacylglycerol O-acyltransferase / trehalose O-mycolyltransferase [Solirubrobacteraceae bacterium]
MTRLVVVLVALLLAAPAVAAAAKVETFELPSPLVDTSSPGGRLEKDRTVPKVHVLLPDGYSAKRRYPVLWALHGANGGTDTWIPSIKKLYAGFPGIIVMPDGGLFGMYTDWFNGGIRRDPAWATYHLRYFKRVIERRYPIRPGRRWHAISGISMGGQGTLRYAALLPGYFGSAAGFSAAVPDIQSPEAQVGIPALTAAGGDSVTYEAMFGPADGAYAEGNSPQALAANYGHTRLYLTSGNGINCPQDPINPASIALDTVLETAINRQQGPFAEATRAAGADVTAVTTCGVHTFGVWDRAIAAARKWGFFKPVPSRPANWTYRTVAAAGDMWGLRFRFTEPPSVVATFTRTGRTLSAEGSGSVTIRGRRGCRFRAKLPFERRPCSRP